MKKEITERMEEIMDDEAFEAELRSFPVPKPISRYDRDFEVPRNEFSQYTSCGDFSYGKKVFWNERRLVAQVAELKAQGCKMLPDESLEEFVARNIDREEVS